ncbi:MAG: hypothetical protein Q9159_004365 [Coniocarpon cinnabarinum]
MQISPEHAARVPAWTSSGSQNRWLTSTHEATFEELQPMAMCHLPAHDEPVVFVKSRPSQDSGRLLLCQDCQTHVHLNVSAAHGILQRIERQCQDFQPTSAQRAANPSQQHAQEKNDGLSIDDQRKLSKDEFLQMLSAYELGGETAMAPELSENWQQMIDALKGELLQLSQRAGPCPEVLLQAYKGFLADMPSLEHRQKLYVLCKAGIDQYLWGLVAPKRELTTSENLARSPNNFNNIEVRDSTDAIFGDQTEVDLHSSGGLQLGINNAQYNYCSVRNSIAVFGNANISHAYRPTH